MLEFCQALKRGGLAESMYAGVVRITGFVSNVSEPELWKVHRWFIGEI